MRHSLSRLSTAAILGAALMFPLASAGQAEAPDTGAARAADASGDATVAAPRSERRAGMRAARAEPGWRERGPRLQVERGRRTGAGMAPPWLDFDRIDADGDGVISRAEFEAALESRAKGRGGLRRKPSRD